MQIFSCNLWCVYHLYDRKPRIWAPPKNPEKLYIQIHKSTLSCPSTKSFWGDDGKVKVAEFFAGYCIGIHWDMWITKNVMKPPKIWSTYLHITESVITDRVREVFILKKPTCGNKKHFRVAKIFLVFIPCRINGTRC